MTRDGVNQIMLDIFNRQGGVRRWNYDQKTLADILIGELAERWDMLPEVTKATMLGVAYDLKLQSIDTETAGEVAAIVVDRVMQKSRMTR
ncbi:MAG: hypothetical protein V4614_18360 [Pseudomonadota bacterium]